MWFLQKLNMPIHKGARQAHPETHHPPVISREANQMNSRKMTVLEQGLGRQRNC